MSKILREFVSRLFASACPTFLPTMALPIRHQASLLETTDEAVTLSGGGVAETLFEEVRRHFNEKQLVDLTWAVVAINGWNRVAISCGVVPGSYQPGKKPE